MRIKTTNCSISKQNAKFVITIAMPDGSFNYIHSESFDHPDLAYKARQRILRVMLDNCKIWIEPDGTYYRIKLIIMTIIGEGKTQPLNFHSRKLNLNDAVEEMDQLIQE